MHILAMKVFVLAYEYEVVAEMNCIAQMNNCERSFANDQATINGRFCTTTIMEIKCKADPSD